MASGPAASTDLIPPASTRRGRRARARRRKRRLALGGTLLVVAAVAALGLTGVVHVPGTSDSDRAQGADSRRHRASDRAVPALPAPRPLGVDDPLRLWIGGDSLAGSLGPSLGLMTAQTGVVQPQFDSRVSSGLENPGFFDWPEHALREMGRLDPEAVVFIIGTNDTSIVPPTGGRAGPASTTASTTAFTNAAGLDWRADYTRRVDQMMQILVGDGRRTVYWVGAPIMKSPALSAGVRALDEIAKDVASRHPEVTYVDTYDLFADANGSYAASLPGPDSKSVLMRAGDGIHLTPQGGDRMARAVLDVIDRRWHVRAQAVPGHVRPVLETEGSSRVPGTSRKVGTITPTTSVPRSSSPTVTTAPAESAPPSTAAPTTTTVTPTTSPAHTTSTSSGTYRGG